MTLVSGKPAIEESDAGQVRLEGVACGVGRDGRTAVHRGGSVPWHHARHEEDTQIQSRRKPRAAAGNETGLMKQPFLQLKAFILKTRGQRLV